MIFNLCRRLGDFLNPAKRRERQMMEETLLRHQKEQQRIFAAHKAETRIKSYPTWDLSQAEFEKLPRDCSREFLATCPLGTWFVCTANPLVPHIIVIGQVVHGLDMFADQAGAAALSLPARGINRYQLHLTEYWEKPDAVAV